MNMRLFGIVLPIILLNCCAPGGREAGSKFTASLSQAVTSMKDSTRLWHALCVPSSAITPAMLQEAREHCASADAVSDHLLKVTCTGTQLDALAALTWIEHIDLDPEHKFDLALRSRVRKLQHEQSQSAFDVLGKCAKAISPELKSKLDSSGARLTTTIADVFTAEVTLTSLYALAGLEEVTLLQLSETRDPK